MSGEWLTIRKLRESTGFALTVDDFITQPGPCENSDLFMPFTTVPTHLMDRSQAEKAQTALEKCIDVVGAWGELRSKFDTDDFKIAAQEFSEATGGVDAKQLFTKLFNNLNTSDGCF